MSTTQRLKHQLETARGFSLRLLRDFTEPQQWVKQLCEQSNHALWFAGHMAVSDNFFISLVAPEKSTKQENFQELFGIGSQPSPKLEDYPAIDAVRGFMDDRRAVLLEILDHLSDDDLPTKTPSGTPDFLSDYQSVFETAVWHEGMHSGQLSLIRRSLGHGPAMGG